MITEDYVSFEVAKLLKEKEFDWECISYYVNDEPNDIKYSFCEETNSTWESRCCSAPTLQMAMKWLREKGIYISIVYGDYPALNEIYWIPQIDSLTGFDIPDWFYQEYPSYEEACEAAIKYCLENLI